MRVMHKLCITLFSSSERSSSIYYLIILFPYREEALSGICDAYLFMWRVYVTAELVSLQEYFSRIEDEGIYLLNLQSS